MQKKSCVYKVSPENTTMFLKNTSKRKFITKKNIGNDNNT